MRVAGDGIGYGQKKDDVKEGTGGASDRSALEETRGLGRAVVSLLKELSS